MRDFQNNDQSEFEREFEFEDEITDTLNEYEGDASEFELENDEYELENELNSDNEYNDEFGSENEADYLSEFEDEYELENEFENTPDGRFERQLYEVFTNNYENEFEFENAFNEVMHGVQQEYFFNLKSLKKIGRKLAPVAKLALKTMPGGSNLLNAVKQITKDPRGLLKTLAMKFGPQALNAIVPGAGVALGAVLNSEMDDAARQAAKDTLALARESYANFADEISKTNFTGSLPAVKAQLNTMAKNSFKRAYNTVRLGSRRSRYRKVNRKVEDKRNGMYKIVTITYKMV
jgi:hypothetical protein